MGRRRRQTGRPLAAAAAAALVALLVRTAEAQSQGYDYDILGFQDASDLDTGRHHQPATTSQLLTGSPVSPLHTEPLDCFASLALQL